MKQEDAEVIDHSITSKDVTAAADAGFQQRDLFQESKKGPRTDGDAGPLYLSKLEMVSWQLQHLMRNAEEAGQGSEQHLIGLNGVDDRMPKENG